MIDRENHCKQGKKKEKARKRSKVYKGKKKEKARKRSKVFKKEPFMGSLITIVVFLLFTVYSLYSFFHFHTIESGARFVFGIIASGFILYELFDKISYDSMQLVYGFDYFKELELYKSKNSNKSFMYYSEWKSHIISEYEELIGYEDFYRDLSEKARSIRTKIELDKTIYLPLIGVIMGAIGLFSSIYGITKISIIISFASIFVFVTFTISLTNLYTELHYNEDLMKIVFPNDAEK